MEMMQITVFGLIGAFCSLLLKKSYPQFALCVALITGIILLFWICTPLGELLQQLQEIATQAGVQDGYFAIVLKVIGIAYLSQFGAQLCSDAGESAIAAKIELAGKVLIMAVAAPILSALLQVVMSLV